MPKVPIIQKNAQTQGMSVGGFSGGLSAPQLRLPDLPSNAGAMQSAADSTARIGEAISGVANTAYDIAIEAQNRADYVMALEARTKLDGWESANIFDPQNGALAQRGKNALDVPERYMKSFDDFTSGIKSGLANDRQKEAFTKMSLERRASVFGVLQRHTGQELQSYAKNQALYAADSAINRASEYYTDDNIRDSAIAQAQGSIAAYGKFQGWPEEMTRQKMLEVSEKAYGSILERYALESPSDATKMLQGNSGVDGILDRLLVREGGFVAQDGASGAPANFGINQAANPDINVKDLNAAQAKEIYKKRYWDKYGIDSLPVDVQEVVFDGVVNHRSNFAQSLVVAAKDGATNEQLLAMRRAEYERLATENPEKYGKFLDGWLARIDGIQQDVSSSPEWVKKVPFDARQKILKIAQTGLRAELSEKVRNAGARAAVGIQDPNPLPREEFVNALGAIDGEKEYQAYVDNQNFAVALNKVATQTDAEQDALLSSLAPTELSSESDLKRYQALTSAVNHSREQRTKDPMAYAMGSGLAPKVQPFNLGANLESQLYQRLDAATAMRFTYGTPLRLFTQDEGKKLAADIKNMPPEKQVGLLTVMGEALTPEAFGAAAGEIYAGGAPMAGLAAGYLQASKNGATQGYEVAVSVLRGDALLNPAKGEKPTIRLPNDSGTEGISVTLNDTVGEALAYNPERMASAIRAAKAVYADKAQQDGDYSMEWKQDRIADAILSVVGEPVDMGENETLPPWGMPQDEFLEKFKTAWESKKKEAATTYLPESYEDAQIVLFGHGTYMVKSGTDFVRDATGAPIIINVLGE